MRRWVTWVAVGVVGGIAGMVGLIVKKMNEGIKRHRL